jgi:predicted nucleic-acid-binding Zn-ribbon protein
MLLSDCKPGMWYVVVTCNKCKAREPLWPDLSKGKAELIGAYYFRCPICNHTQFYDDNTLEHYQCPLEDGIGSNRMTSL